jgi:anti-sigma regulatory factor (Ser/Thr protein kinase)
MVEVSEDWVRIGVVSKALGLSPSRVRQLADEGRIPSRRTAGGHRLFDLAAVRQSRLFSKPLGVGRDEPAGPPAWQSVVALAGAEEATVWAECRDALGLPTSPATRVMEYAFTEMLNNAIDHSGAAEATVRWWASPEAWTFTISDDGVGVFPNIQRGLGLEDLFSAIQELTKGRTTTAPDHHTGEGIFFTSKAVDLFSLASAGLEWIVDNLRGDQAVGLSSVTKGTRVVCKIDPNSERELRDVFGRFTDDDFDFSKSHTVVRLFGLGVRFVSRSEAKRLLHGLERFKEVEVDFTGVQEVGQGFVDELVRVWPSQHPDIVIKPTGMNEVVEFMVRRGLPRARES